VLRTLFGADSYGTAPGNADDVGFAATAVESGNQSGYESTDPARNFLRTTIVLSCQMFGLPIAPSCLSDAIAQMSKQQNRKTGDGKQTAAPAPTTPPASALPPGTDAAGSPPAIGDALPKPANPSPAPGGGGGNGTGDPSGLLDFLFGSGS
jgi:hypothetical protein